MRKKTYREKDDREQRREKQAIVFFIYRNGVKLRQTYAAELMATEGRRVTPGGQTPPVAEELEELQGGFLLLDSEWQRVNMHTAALGRGG